MEQGLIRVVAIDPTSRGFSYAVLEGSERLVAWGSARVAGLGTSRFGRRFETLLRRYQPQLVVVEEPETTLLGPRAQGLIVEAGKRAVARDIYVETVSRSQVQEHFQEAGATRYEIAVAISRWFPELEAELPPKRKLWGSEDERMHVFDAVSFALTALWPWEWKKTTSIA